jgi:hypothetical protein
MCPETDPKELDDPVRPGPSGRDVSLHAKAAPATTVAMQQASPTPKLIRKIIATLVLIALGCYVLWISRTTAGLWIGVLLVLLGLAIALPAELRSGVDELRHGAVVLLPVVLDVRAGCERRTDAAECQAGDLHSPAGEVSPPSRKTPDDER